LNPLSKTKRATRNYELDRTLSHSRNVPGSVQRLSVAVVVDYRQRLNGAGEIERIPLRPEEMDYITTLVKEAVGFDEHRGDSVNVINASFVDEDALEPLPDPPIWEQPWLLDVLKQLLGVVLVIVLIFGVLRPVMRGLVQENKEADTKQLSTDDNDEKLLDQEDTLSLTHQGQGKEQSGTEDEVNGYQLALNDVSTIVKDDPKLVSQVVKGWLTEEDN
jgi:flagellar M-ring protein FliF